MKLKVTIPGKAQTQGSMIPVRRKGKTILIPDNKALYGWRDAVSMKMKKVRPEIPYDCAMSVIIRIFVKRPEDHYTVKGLIRKGAPEYPFRSGGDDDKVARAVFDAGTGIWWFDDRRIVSHRVERRYADACDVCCVVEAEPMPLSGT